jgi:Ca2+-binding RTX toxin-like protein
MGGGIMQQVIGTNDADVGATALRASNTQNAKIDGKDGDDYLIGKSGDDLLIGGKGSDVMMGGRGADTFAFTKFANEGDVDYVTDFKREDGDKLSFSGDVKVTKASYVDGGIQEFNGVDLFNDSKALDVVLTIQITDGGKVFEQQIYLVDALKNTTWDLAAFNKYLDDNYGYTDGIEAAA